MRASFGRIASTNWPSFVSVAQQMDNNLHSSGFPLLDRRRTGHTQ
jgi:hypothetical protein